MRHSLIYAVSIFLAMTAGTGLKAQDYYSDRTSIKTGSMEYVIEHSDYSWNHSVSLTNVQNHYFDSFPCYSDGSRYRRGVLEMQREDVLNIVKQVFSPTEIDNYAQSQEKLELTFVISPKNGKILGMKFYIYKNKDNILMNIPVEKFATLEQKLMSQYVQKDVPGTEYPEFASHCYVDFKEIRSTDTPSDKGTVKGNRKS